MAYVITKPCIGTKDRSCVEVCPVDCFYDIRKKTINSKYGVDPKEITWEDGYDVAFGGDDDGDKNKDWGMLIIHPDECINCGACETECPVEAIYEDSSVVEKEFITFAETESAALTDEQLEKSRCTTRPAR